MDEEQAALENLEEVQNHLVVFKKSCAIFTKELDFANEQQSFMTQKMT